MAFGWTCPYETFFHIFRTNSFGSAGRAPTRYCGVGRLPSPCRTGAPPPSWTSRPRTRPRSTSGITALDSTETLSSSVNLFIYEIVHVSLFLFLLVLNLFFLCFFLTLSVACDMTRLNDEGQVS